MTTAFNISGSLFSRTITLNEIEEIKNAKNSNEINNLWDKIVDWFCGTNKENAKIALFTLLNNDDAKKKIDAFNQLKTMASPAFKEAFTYTTTAISDTEFTVNLSIGALFSTGEFCTPGETINLSDHIKTFSEKCFSKDNDTTDFIQLKKDIPRSSIYFYKTSNDKTSNVKTKFEIDDLPSLENKITEKQKKPLNVALSQIGAIDIIQQINEQSKEMSIIGNPKQKTFISLDGSGNITIKTHLFQHINAEDYPFYKQFFPDSKYPSLLAEAHVNIASDGTCDIVKITLSHPGIE